MRAEESCWRRQATDEVVEQYNSDAQMVHLVLVRQENADKESRT